MRVVTRQDTIKELVKAGKGADVKALLIRHGEAAQRGYDEIRNDARSSEDFKKQQLALAHLRAQQAVDAELDREVRKVVHLDRDDASVVFGTKGIDGDAASLIIARRDAGDRVSNVTDSAELDTMLRRATRRGDEVMARAIAERATEIGDTGVMNQFLADRPKLEQAGERLWNAERATQDWDMGITAGLSDLRASEFAGMDIGRIETIAEGNDVAAAPSRGFFDSTSATAGGQRMASAHGFAG